MNQWKDTTIHGYLWLMGKLSGQFYKFKAQKRRFGSNFNY